MKQIVKVISMLLVGITMFTGALYIVEGIRENDRRNTAEHLAEESNQEGRAL